MRRRVTAVLAAVAAVAALLPAAAGAAPTPVAVRGSTDGLVPVVVRLRPAADPGAVGREVAAAHGGRTTGVYRHAVTGFAAHLPPHALTALRADPRVAAVEPDHPLELFFVPTGVARVGADRYAPADIDGDGRPTDVDIAVLDTGIDAAHPDLDVAGGVDCADGSCSPVASPTDRNGHGTHIAGTAAARDDGEGVVGVAPGARLWSVGISDDAGNSSLSALLAGLDWLVANAAAVEVANISLGCDCLSPTLDAAVGAVADAGVVLVVAAGNSTVDAAGVSPANHPDVIAVSAVTDYDGADGGQAAAGCLDDLDDTFASYSNFGAVVDLAAPGSCIVSTWPGGLYARETGTSMAAPHVAGAAALHILAEGVPRSAERPAAVRDALVEKFSVPQSHACGFSGGRSDEPLLHLSCGSPGSPSPAPSGANDAPTVTVVAPVVDGRAADHLPVRLVGTATDPEDGELSDRIAWRSDRDGELARGLVVEVRLSAGTHTITATVTDAAGASATAATRLVVGDAAGLGARGLTDACPPGSVPSGGFTDVAADDPHAPAIDCVAWWGVAEGSGAGTYAPAAAVSRAQMASFIARLVQRSGGTLPVPTRDYFPDDNGSVHEVAINRLAEAGIVGGRPDGRYGPAGAVTRAQMASFLVAAHEFRVRGELPGLQDRFTDDDGLVHEQRIDAAAGAGFASGVGPVAYGPHAAVTRGQMASFLARVLDLLVEQGEAQPPN